MTGDHRQTGEALTTASVPTGHGGDRRRDRRRMQVAWPMQRGVVGAELDGGYPWLSRHVSHVGHIQVSGIHGRGAQGMDETGCPRRVTGRAHAARLIPRVMLVVVMRGIAARSTAWAACNIIPPA